jgi:hypothetical protein
MRIDWAALPEAVKTEIATRVGGVPEVKSASSGDHAEIATTVTGPAGKVFAKATSSEFGVRSLRYELLVSRAVPLSCSPAVEWDFESDGWLVIGFEHCEGPHADLSPGSPHLDLLEVAVKELGVTPAPDLPLFSPASRLGFDHPALTGETLIHTDLNPANLIVTPNGLRIVDWAFTTKAAPWVELAMLVQWLIGSGHTPDQAEAWLARFPAWSAIDSQILNEFASRNASKWSRKAGQSTALWMHDLAAWTAQWSVYRRRKALKQPR